MAHHKRRRPKSTRRGCTCGGKWRKQSGLGLRQETPQTRRQARSYVEQVRELETLPLRQTRIEGTPSR